jgi:hypothetical protein
MAARNIIAPITMKTATAIVDISQIMKPHSTMRLRKSRSKVSDDEVEKADNSRR